MVNVRKRGNVYEYNFDIAKIAGKRKRVTKSGFKTKAEVDLCQVFRYIFLRIFINYPASLEEMI